MEVFFMILNLKDLPMNNYISWVHNAILDKIKDTGWVDLKLEGDVKLFTEGYNAQVRRVHNTVYFRGRVTNMLSSGTLITIVPHAFRPRDGYSYRFTCPCNGGTSCTVVLNPTSGNMVFDFTSDQQYPAERWVSLNNIVFVND